MATPLKIQTAYLNSPTPITLFFTGKKILDILYRSEITCNFGQIWLPWQLPFALLKIEVAYLNSPTPKTLSYTQSVSISCTEMKLCLFECLAYLCSFLFIHLYTVDYCTQTVVQQFIVLQHSNFRCTIKCLIISYFDFNRIVDCLWSLFH